MQSYISTYIHFYMQSYRNAHKPAASVIMRLKTLQEALIYTSKILAISLLWIRAIHRRGNFRLLTSYIGVDLEASC